MIASILRIDGFWPCSSSWTGSLLANPVAASTAPSSTAASWVKSGYSTISTSSTFEFADAEERLEHDPARSVATWDPDLLALQVGRRLDFGRVLGKDDVGELAVDRGEVGDRDGPADGGDDAGPVADPDIDGSLADQRDEVLVDLALELDVQAGIGVVAVLLCEVELRELDARDVSEPDDELSRGDARLRRFARCEGGGRRVRRSIGGNHLNHGARKNINMTYFIMDNFVYGLTKKQTSPTSPIGFKSKTDPTGAIDQPVNPMKQLICAGATFIARTHATQVNHMIQMIERAMDHQGFSVIECLSECVEFFPGAFDPANPRKGGAFSLIEERKWDNTPEDELRHDVTDELAAYKLAQIPFPGVFGVFYENDRPTKNALEKKWIDSTREKLGNPSDIDILQKTFDRMK